MVRAWPNWNWGLIDTDAPFVATRRIWRSLAFRTRFGPAVTAINRHVLQNLPAAPVELIWVDKGVCLWPETIRRLRRLAKRLIYYTPDTSFLHNQSRFFNRTIDLYDLVVTTKSQEVATFQRLIPPERLLLVTQTYDRLLHYPRCSFADKRPEAVLIGLCEPSREECVATLLDGGIAVRVAGHGWQRFVRRHQGNRLLCYEGVGVFGERYSQLLSAASVGLGLLTHRFLELHTTRTLEIPACGTVLATPRTPETVEMFGAHEALFFDTYSELSRRIATVLSDPRQLQTLAEAGRERVLAQPWDNDSLVSQIVQRVR